MKHKILSENIPQEYLAKRKHKIFSKGETHNAYFVHIYILFASLWDKTTADEVIPSMIERNKSYPNLTYYLIFQLCSYQSTLVLQIQYLTIISNVTEEDIKQRKM